MLLVTDSVNSAEEINTILSKDSLIWCFDGGDGGGGGEHSLTRRSKASHRCSARS